MAHLCAQGYEADDVGVVLPWDITAGRRNYELHVEVKGSTVEREAIDLTEGEVRHAGQTVHHRPGHHSRVAVTVAVKTSALSGRFRTPGHAKRRPPVAVNSPPDKAQRSDSGTRCHRRLARVSVVVSPVRPPKLMMPTSVVRLMTFHSSTSGRTDLETDLLPWVTHPESPRIRPADQLICGWHWSNL